MIRIVLFSILCLGCWSCNDDPNLQDITENPKVFFRGDIDSGFVNWEAGVDNEFNYTSISTNEFDFYSMHSALDDIDESGPKLEFILLDPDEKDANISNDIRFSKGEREFLYQANAIKSYDLRLHSPHLDNYLVDHEWIIDGVSHQSEKPELTFNHPGSKIICLKGVTADGDTIHTCKRINLDQNRWVDPMLQIKDESADSITVVANIAELTCDRWEWNGYDAGDYVFRISKENWASEFVHLRMFNSNYLISDILFKGEYDSNDEPKIGWPGFSHQFLRREIGDRFQHGKVIVNYVHPSDGFFSSKFAENQDGFFEIKNVEEFERNENDQPTVLVSFQFKAQLATEFGHQMTIESDEVSMAFPIPE